MNEKEAHARSGVAATFGKWLLTDGRPAAVSRYVSTAEEFLQQGKQRKALEELWYAEGLARGNAEALGAVLETATGYEGRMEGPRREADLAELIRVVRDDLSASPPSSSRTVAAGSAGRHVSTSAPHPKTVTAGVLAAFLAAAVGGAALGLVVGGGIGEALYPPGSGDFGIGSGWVYGAPIGLVIGAVAGVLAVWALRHRQQAAGDNKP